MAKAVKLADIAERVGVSVVTVSKALSGQKGVSEEMRARIVQLADELGYKQPSALRRDRQDGGYNIGVLIHESYLDRYSSFYWQMYQHVATFAMERGCFTMLEVISRQMEKAAELPHILAEQKVDGYIVIGPLDDTYIRKLRKEVRMPSVFMDYSDPNQKVDAVVSDGFGGGYYATNYLFEMGHKNIAYVGTVLATGSITDRYLGYMKSLLEHGQQIRPEWVIEDRDVNGGLIDEEKKLVLPVTGHGEKPTAFFCNCDLTAGYVIRKLEKMGYSIPDDFSVIGYDNYIHPGICDVPITTYEVDLQEMAVCAVKRLIFKMGEADFTCRTHIVEGHIVVKQSVTRKI